MNKQKHVRATYNILAADYARTFTEEHRKKPLDMQMLIRFAQKIGIRTPVWDLGCGPGHTAAYLNGLGIDACGLDLSEAMVKQAKTAFPDVFFRQGDLLALPFDDETVAGVSAFYAIVHFSKAQVRQALKEIFRVLEPGGIALITFHAGEHRIQLDSFLGNPVNLDVVFFTGAFIGDCLENTGFSGIDIIERDPYPAVEYQSRRAYAFAEKPFQE